MQFVARGVSPCAWRFYASLRSAKSRSRFAYVVASFIWQCQVSLKISPGVSSLVFLRLLQKKSKYKFNCSVTTTPRLLSGPILLFCLCVVGFILVLCWSSAGAVLLLFRFYSGATLRLLWDYSGATLVLLWCCSGIVLVLFWCY